MRMQLLITEPKLVTTRSEVEGYSYWVENGPITRWLTGRQFRCTLARGACRSRAWKEANRPVVD